MSLSVRQCTFVPQKYVSTLLLGDRLRLKGIPQSHTVRQDTTHRSTLNGVQALAAHSNLAG